MLSAQSTSPATADNATSTKQSTWSRSQAIENPISLVQSLFEANYQTDAATSDFGIPAYFRKEFGSSEAALQEIPSLMNRKSLDGLRDGQLVRFRCMVQDNGYAPEVYVPVGHYCTPSGEKKSFCFQYHEQDAPFPVSFAVNSAGVFKDKAVFYACSVPAETKWSCSLRSPIEERLGEMSVSTSDKAATSPEADKKQPVPWEDSIGAIVKVYQEKDFQLNDTLEVVGILDKNALTPIVHAILVRRLHLSDHPEYVGSSLCLEKGLFEEDGPTQLSVQTFEQNEKVLLDAVAKYAPNLVSSVLSPFVVTEIRSELVRWLADACLLGDRLLAEYLLLWLVARIYRRAPDLTLGNLSLTITRCPVTSGDTGASAGSSSNAFVQRFYQVLQALVPKALMVPLTVKNLNELEFVPKAMESSGGAATAAAATATAAASNNSESQVLDEDELGQLPYAVGSLQSGLLQLTKGTFMVLDETSLLAGQLQQRGIQNLSALRQVLTHHSLQYNFLQPISFDKELHVVVLSEGESGIGATVKTEAEGQVRTSLLPTDVSIPILVPSDQDSGSGQADGDNSPFSHPWLPLFRLFLAYFRGAGSVSHDYAIPDEMAKTIEKEFAAQRQRASQSNGAEALMSDMDLLQRLGLARLLAISNGRTELDMTTWERAKTMETARVARLSKPAVPQAGH